MQYKTFAQIKSKVQQDLDIEVEEFIQPTEFIEIINDGISRAEALIHKLGLEDEYFLTRAFLPLVAGQEDYVLPNNIYMNKIKSVQYSDGTTIYTIGRIRGPNRFEEIARINQYNTVTDYYNYIIRNDAPTAPPTLQLIPKSRETSSTNVTVWFYRESNKWVSDETQSCDLPTIAMQFLYAYAKYWVLFKEGHASAGDAKDNLDRAEKDMMATLEQMVADDNTEVHKDLSIYSEMS